LFSLSCLKICYADDIKIIQKPIVFDKERIQLTKEYRLQHYGIKSDSIKIKPRMIVLHWTVLESLGPHL
jgi:hypothetical protein